MGSNSNPTRKQTIERHLAKEIAIMQSPSGQKTTVAKVMMHKLLAEGWRRVN